MPRQSVTLDTLARYTNNRTWWFTPTPGRKHQLQSRSDPRCRRSMIFVCAKPCCTRSTRRRSGHGPPGDSRALNGPGCRRSRISYEAERDPFNEYNPELSRRLLAVAGYRQDSRPTLFMYIGGPAAPVSNYCGEDMLGGQAGHSGEPPGPGDFGAWEVRNGGRQLRCADDVHALDQDAGNRTSFLDSHLDSESVPESNYSRYANVAGGPADLRGLGRDGS